MTHGEEFRTYLLSQIWYVIIVIGNVQNISHRTSLLSLSMF